MPPVGVSEPIPEPGVGGQKMPPVPLSDAERYKEQAAKEPKREDFPAEKMPLWKKILGLVSAGAAGFGRHDDTTYNLTRKVLGAPEAAAEKKYGQAEDIWKRGLEAIQKESGLKNTESEMRKRDVESEQLENKPAAEHQDIVKEFSDALAKGDTARIDALTPRVKQYLETTQKPAAGKNAEEQIKEQINAEMAKPKPDQSLVKSLQDRLMALKPSESAKDKDISDYLQAHKLEDTPANREKARDAVAVRGKTPRQPTDREEWMKDHPGASVEEYWRAKQGLTTTTRSMIEVAPKVKSLIGRMKQRVDEAEDGLGPMAGRWREFKAGKVGWDDPTFSKLRTDAALLQTALMRMHVGARGGELIMQHFKDLFDVAKQSPDNLRAALDEINLYADDVMSEGKIGGKEDQTSGGKGGSKAKVLVEGKDF